MRTSRHRSKHHRGRSPSRRRPLLVTLIVVVVLVVCCVAWGAAALLHSPPRPTLAVSLGFDTKVPGTPLALDVAQGVQEAVAVDGIGLMASAGSQRPTPIASLTKMMSALVVLQAHPLAPGESGPAITVTQADVSAYQTERRQGDSVVAVRVGEQLSELQALEAALIPSGDNIIELLAVWDAGSITAFTSKMNAAARSLGLAHTHYAGPSGVDPATVSTAMDQLRLAEVDMQNPVFAKIVSMPQVTLPVAGVQYNVDSDLGSDGIDGIKTGWIPAGGASFVFSASYKFAGHRLRIIGDVVGEQGSSPLPTALSVAKELVLASERNLRMFQVSAGSTVAMVAAPYADSVRVVSASSLALVAWSGAHLRVTVQAPATLPVSVAGDTRVGTLTIALGDTRAVTGVRTTSRLQGPSFGWRLEHP